MNTTIATPEPAADRGGPAQPLLMVRDLKKRFPVRGHLEADPIHRMNELFLPFERVAAHREALLQVAHHQQRLRRAAAIGRRLRNCVVCAHFRMSMAERRPSASRLNAIEVMKIMAPGRAATSGLL